MFHILVVEDDKDLNRTVCSYLNQNGFEAKGALEAEEAYDLMYETVFDFTETTFLLSATESLAGADEEVFAMTFRYEKTDGEFTLSVTADAQTVNFGGIIAVNADEATFAITSLGADEVSIGMNIAFTIRATATIPEPPTDTKDVLSLSESELAALAETVMSSPLAVLFGELISNMQTPPVE